ncbi:F(1)-ATPase inhibitor IF(1), mitochondrial [Trichomonascus vanleenenianus]|uniref:F(1)-ATPase inhibitor IF(1), mitochondrial n=1 Tax=Trichomonascus vanleenenianus TaxID=2268995 RepID=UPI003ECB7C48
MISSIARRAILSKPAFNMGAVRAYTEGATGAPRPEQGGSDAFNKRERAQEDYYVRQHEAEKLKALREELQKAKEERQKSDDNIEKLNKEIDQLKNGN